MIISKAINLLDKEITWMEHDYENWYKNVFETLEWSYLLRVLKNFDLMIFPKATKINAYAIHKLLHEYAQNSCQHPSPTKWNVLGGSISSIRMRHVAGILGFHIIQENFDYLKLPMFKGKPRVQHLRPIVHRVIAKLYTWKEHTKFNFLTQ